MKCLVYGFCELKLIVICVLTFYPGITDYVLMTEVV